MKMYKRLSIFISSDPSGYHSQSQCFLHVIPLSQGLS